MRESTVERVLQKSIKQQGGWCLKFVSPGTARQNLPAAGKGAGLCRIEGPGQTRPGWQPARVLGAGTAEARV